ncbi:ABC transporter permease [Lutibaculum baratangense]|uniref:Putative permease protein of sugar ABC transporter n=1 Tax=Lutibaculum baratangense AMV1 TaxID=631454 RepID=V4RKL7_9HYPH|nr:ABC transporter permease [Lutibaculum baratangense]ESR26596.1 putative permease protein of sugar ABC transporter [Lutibaculum baratangense AMV1]
MRLEVTRRAAPSKAMAFLSPVIAIALTVFAGLLIFAAAGLDPLRAVHLYFVSPFTSLYSLQEVLVKASPLVLIGVGLSLCFRANVWNIGAEGQYTLGAVCGGGVALAIGEGSPFLVLPCVIAAGILGGLAWAAIPALLKTVFRANEILTSLMLTYVALYLLDYLVRGPWRDPMGFNFPQSALFEPAATLPVLTSDGRLHLGVAFAVLAVAIAAVALPATLRGFSIRVAGSAPKAARFAGFSQSGTVLFVFLTSGALAGLAGVAEVTGTLQQLLPEISPGYGFTAIIVAFLGRLNPVGILFAGVVLSASYIGGEVAQLRLGLPVEVAMVFQGILLFFLLACDSLIHHRIAFRRAAPRTEARHVG